MGTDASILFQIQHLSDNPRVALEKYQARGEGVGGGAPGAGASDPLFLSKILFSRLLPRT